MRSLGQSIKQETYVEVSGLFLLSVSKWSIRLDILRTVDEGCRELYSNEILGTKYQTRNLCRSVWLVSSFRQQMVNLIGYSSNS